MKSFILLVLVLVLINCDREQDVRAEAQPTVVTVQQQASTAVNVVALGPDVNNIQSLDLNNIDFEPSKQPLSFSSIAIGDFIATTDTRNKIVLTTSGWTHPSVLFFETKWNGYFYWCALTPYPNSDAQYENPHIFCSNDGVTWIEPLNIINPLEYSPLGLAYSSDVNLMFKDGALYCYWRDNNFVFNGRNSRALYVKKSFDGINWTPKEMVANWSATGLDVISPSILQSESDYFCYGVCTGETTPGSYYTQYCIRRTSSKNQFSFLIDRNKGYDLINIKGRPWGEKQEPWHTDVQKIGNIWLILVATTDNGKFGANSRLFLGYSADGLNFSFEDKPICNSIGTYKSGFVPTYDRLNKRIKIQLWRSASANNWQVFYDEFFIHIS